MPMTAPQDRLLLVFVHGFRGTDTTFKDFPERLKAIATSSDVHTIVYPRYKTSGDFNVAVHNLQVWLQDQVKQQQTSMASSGQAGSVLVVLLGHSMGGLVSAEVILRQKGQDLLGTKARIIGLLAYDTPFYSLNHRFVSGTALSHMDKLNNHVSRFFTSNTSTATTSSRSVSSTAKQITWTGATSSTTTRAAAAAASTTATKKSSSGWGLLAGVVGVAAVGAAAYLAKDVITSKVNDAMDHVEFVSTLMDFEACWERMRRLSQLDDVLFRCFYIQLENHESLATDPKTFIALPPPETAHYFIPIPSRAEGEVEAHMSIFNAKKNDHYYTLGLDTMSLISEMLARHQRRSD
ncbi:hypothetical protein RO3G_00161 [Lichtheimia corymbifera JMRC:FSU:9682]|uniref:AB hydrolase-1 domain-containing protein n=1 Tax=Lichtheimia corymbifera JMRC:FSU:9682 TaxID=1263082 RepID=A0A068S6P3_9FUNG|nr:hypothetical protein RO3G_00161 [Lichtheimia corymbifera JMRC:FSU:9682]